MENSFFLVLHYVFALKFTSSSRNCVGLSFIWFVTYIELQSGVEIIVRHNVHLTHLWVHVPLNSHQPSEKLSHQCHTKLYYSEKLSRQTKTCAEPDDGRLPTRLSSCLRVILKILANSVHNFGQMLIGSRIRDLAIWMINLENLKRLTPTNFLPSWVPSPLILKEPTSTFFLGSTWEGRDRNFFTPAFSLPGKSSPQSPPPVT